MILANRSCKPAYPPPLTVPKVRKAGRATGPVYFFLDFSNIAIAASRLAQQLEEDTCIQGRLRLHCENLRAIAERGRPWGSGFAAAGLANVQSCIKQKFDDVGITMHISERGVATHSEQNVDERIQYEMLRLLPRHAPPGVVALATGDGAGHKLGEGFLPTLQYLHECGFSIEVLSWEHSFNRELRSWVETHGRAIVLDPFYEELTFIDGGRSALPRHLLNKKLAAKRLSA